MGVQLAVGQAVSHDEVMTNLSEIENVDMMLYIHFPTRQFGCKYCSDRLEGYCGGEGLKGYKKVKRCMQRKLGEGELLIIIGGQKDANS